MNNTTTEDVSRNNISNVKKRKRINRIKTGIVTFSLVLLILPSIFCAILTIKLVRLQNQVNKLIFLYNREHGENAGEGFDNIAYAAEKPSIIPSYIPSEETEEKTSADQWTESSELKSAEPSERPKAEPSTIPSIKPSKTQAEKFLKEHSDEQVKTEITSDMKSAVTDMEDANTHTDDNDNKESGTDQTENTGRYDKQDKQDKKNKKNKHGNSSDNDEKERRFENKTVYLTFDDGPSIYTDDILDILNEYGVKATFFVVGKTDSFSKEMYKRIVDDGHTLGMHSYSHKYDVIYKSIEDFDKDFTKLWNLLYDTTGLEPKIYRFPGGSANEVNKKGMDEFIKYLNEKSIVYYDWNVLNGDATNIKYTEEQLIDNVLTGVEAKKRSIVLMHDAASKEATVKTLPRILKELISGGAQLYPLDANVEPIQMIKADSVK